MTAPPEQTASPSGTSSPPDDSRRSSILRLGRLSWAALGVVGMAVVTWYVISHLMLMAVPLVLAIFPATLLIPAVKWLDKRGLPRSVAALVTLFVALGVSGGIFGLTGTMVASGLPDVAESAREGLEQLEDVLQRVSPGVSLEGWTDVADMARERFGGDGSLSSQVMSLTSSAFEFLTGLILLIVILFFYLLDGRGLAEAMVGLAPRKNRRKVMKTAQESWESLGAYTRGLLLVALCDAILIGLGLVVLGVPLALPLAVLTFFAALFPIIGALVAGAVAVLVALSHGGLTTGLIMAGIILLVQQFEGNVMGPYILGEAIGLHPLLILASVTAGGLLLGVLGAFLAVPVATVVGIVWNATVDDAP